MREARGVTINVGPKEKDTDGTKRRLITASIDLSRAPELDEQSRILIPTEERALCESVTEDTVGIISVLKSCSQGSVSSPVRCACT